MAARSSRGLIDAGVVTADRLAELEEVAGRFAIGVTDAMLDLIDPTDPDDPIARQFVPSAAELEVRVGERADPIGDAPHSPVPGIVHRYPDRLLLKLVQVCPVYCRFCFRRELIGPGTEALSAEELEGALAYIADHPEIWEVILTGGDPLVLSPRRLAEIKARLDAIPHVGIVRIHTRVPSVDPGRITPELVEALKGRTPVWILLHANHPREFTEAARAACARLVDAGIPMLGQSVLLRGVNDDAATLEALFRAMVQARIKPHYLHQGDLALGTSQFRTSLEHGRALVKQLRGRVSGLCQPTYMLDIPGGHGKVPAAADQLEAQEHGWLVEDPWGRRHLYDPDARDAEPGT